VITDFSRKTQPIVRYKLNDILTLRAQPCPCGSPKTALDFIEGRSDDLFHLPAANGMGTITIYPDFIRRTMLFASEQIRDYRVVQTGPADLRVELNCGGADAPVRLAVQKEFAALMGTLGCRLDKVEFVTLSTLSTLSYGRKLRRVVNEYATPRAH
jgi:putative adenylate-forming enzyme